MIDGQGADELLGGYQYYFAVKQNDWMNTNRWYKLITNTLLHARYLRREAEKYENADRRFNTAGAGSVREHIRIARENRQLRKQKRGLIAQPSVTMRPGTPDPANGNFFRHYLATGLLYTMLPNQLVMSDKTAMAFGVEARFPFLDYQLVDWAIHLPDDILVRNGWQKWVLRKSMQGLLPEDVQWRGDKVGFAAPQDQWLRGPIRNWAHDLLFTGPVTDLPYYNREELQTLWDRHLAGEELSWPLWRWISINEWLRLARDGVWKDGLAPSVSKHSNEVFAESRGMSQV
jgi:asparagine synthase (glutamine-hydrolysing)